jgi:hypothetical protein
MKKERLPLLTLSSPMAFLKLLKRNSFEMNHRQNVPRGNENFVANSMWPIKIKIYT